ncbi:MAG: hypothetical protein M9921_14560 [Fimbriimonadaceae bacterium]|nr:hypothetical protein [Chthonomonadaceae bacterium]MCO5298067.1 hypothetical protein [Fimbriimonadaceae bacterium]
MDEEQSGVVSPRIVLQILTLESRRRVWLARALSQGNHYRTVEAPTNGLVQFHGTRVEGLLCAETPAGRARILDRLGHHEPLDWREVSILEARRLARKLAARRGGVVHLALFDEPTQVVWEPVAIK